MPTVIVDVGIGQRFSYIDLDMPGIVDHMRSQNMADADIAKTTIHLVEDRIARRSRFENVGFTFGRYDKRKKEAIVRPTIDATMDDAGRMELDGPTAAYTSQVLVHELKHRAINTRGNKTWAMRLQDAELAAKIGGITLGPLSVADIIGFNVGSPAVELGMSAVGLGVSMFSLMKFGRTIFENAYENSLEEAACREVEEGTETVFVTTDVKDRKLF